jgi:hypothetical protein
MQTPYRHEDGSLCFFGPRLPLNTELWKYNNNGHPLIRIESSRRAYEFLCYFALGLKCPYNVMRTVILRTWWAGLTLSPTETRLLLYVHEGCKESIPGFYYYYDVDDHCAWLGLK